MGLEEGLEEGWWQGRLGEIIGRTRHSRGGDVLGVEAGLAEEATLVGADYLVRSQPSWYGLMWMKHVNGLRIKATQWTPHGGVDTLLSTQLSSGKKIMFARSTRTTHARTERGMQLSSRMHMEP